MPKSRNCLYVPPEIRFQTEPQRAGTQHLIAIGCGAIDGDIQTLDSGGNAMNMYRNDDGQFNVDSNNRDYRDSDYGPRVEVSRKSHTTVWDFV